MDKELLRIVIIATGLLVIVGMLLWAYIKDKNSRRGQGFFDDEEIIGKIDKALIINTENDDFDIVPLGPLRDELKRQDDLNPGSPQDEPFNAIEAESPLDENDEEPPPRFVAPEIIQFSIVAKSEQGFNGGDLMSAFKVAGLEYGALQIFERLDANRKSLFGIANLVTPGNFPKDALDSFYCPGIVCFMQPAELDDAVSVFEDYMETIELLAKELDGDILDHQRQPLTVSTVQLIRQSL